MQRAAYGKHDRLATPLMPVLCFLVMLARRWRLLRMRRLLIADMALPAFMRGISWLAD